MRPLACTANNPKKGQKNREGFLENARFGELDMKIMWQLNVSLRRKTIRINIIVQRMQVLETSLEANSVGRQ